LTLTLDQSSAADVHASHPSRVEKLTCVLRSSSGNNTHTHTTNLHQLFNTYRRSEPLRLKVTFIMQLKRINIKLLPVD